MQDRWHVSPRLVLQPGLRVDRSSLTGQTTLSPRVSGTLALGQRVAAGRGPAGSHAEPRIREGASVGLLHRLELGERLDPQSRAGPPCRRRPAAGSWRQAQRPRRCLLQALQRSHRGTARNRTSNGWHDSPATTCRRLSGPACRRGAQITTSPVNAARARRTVWRCTSHMPGVRPRQLTGWASYSFGSSQSDGVRRDASVRLRSPSRAEHRCHLQNRLASRPVRHGALGDRSAAHALFAACDLR